MTEQPTRESDGLFVTECISFPRSGHHMLAELLSQYFGERWHYCEWYNEPEKRIEVEPLTNYQKNHDFMLETPIHDDIRYLVQFRNPAPALASRWELELRNPGIPNTREEWQTKMTTWMAYWNGFWDKWVVPDLPNRMIVTYERLLAEPMDTITRVILFLQTSQHVDSQRLSAILDQHPLREQRRCNLHFGLIA